LHAVAGVLSSYTGNSITGLSFYVLSGEGFFVLSGGGEPRRYMDHYLCRSMKKLIIGSLLGIIILACGSKSGSGETTSAADGQAIYKKYCVLCHGIDGKLGVSGAKDITVSQLSEAERVVLITEGKNTMTPFKGVLSPEEIKAVAAYTMTLK
jgi:cytochrome c6